jgi:hypothetical protein
MKGSKPHIRMDIHRQFLIALEARIQGDIVLTRGLVESRAPQHPA